MADKYEDLRDRALLSLRTFLDSLDEKKGKLLAYWVYDYVRFLKKEQSFDPQKLVRYKRGSIVKVHLGYRVGSEEGGLHYAVVVDVENAKTSPVATVIPLTSIKPHTNLAKLHHSKLLLGTEIFDLLKEKIKAEIEETTRLTTSLLKKAEAEQSLEVDPDAPDAKTQTEMQRRLSNALEREVYALNEKLAHCLTLDKEIQKMKPGSIALVGQITTISKIRIYDPLYPSDTLTSIRLSDETMDKLDEKMRALFTKNT